MRKRRTRQHHIEDLGINHVERQVLLANCTLEKRRTDYGYDADISTYRETGEAENGQVSIQLKSTDNIKLIQKEAVLAYDIDKKDLDLWLENIFPVLLILYDAKQEKAYYIELGEYFREKRLTLETK